MIEFCHHRYAVTHTHDPIEYKWFYTTAKTPSVAVMYWLIEEMRDVGYFKVDGTIAIRPYTNSFIKTLCRYIKYLVPTIHCLSKPILPSTVLDKQGNLYPINYLSRRLEKISDFLHDEKIVNYEDFCLQVLKLLEKENFIKDLEI
jgi:hypothetical protein